MHNSIFPHEGSQQNAQGQMFVILLRQSSAHSRFTQWLNQCFIQWGIAKVQVPFWAWPCRTSWPVLHKMSKKHETETPNFSMAPSTPAKNFGVKWLGDTGTDHARHHWWKLFVSWTRSHTWSKEYPHSTNCQWSSSHQHCSGYPLAGSDERIFSLHPQELTTGTVNRLKMHGRWLFRERAPGTNPLLVRPDGKVVEFKMNSRTSYLDDE